MGQITLYPRLPTLLRAPINFSASGDQTIVAADTNGNRIVVHRIWLVAGGATNLTFKDNLSSPAAVPLSANGGITFDATGEPWFVTNVNTALIINSSSAVQVSGMVYYTLAL